MVNNDTNIPTRFYKEIATHVVTNLIIEKQANSSVRYKTPLLLGVHGKSGQGKTFQIEQCLQDLNVEIFHISGSQLESEKAGEPAKLLKTTYLKAGQHSRNNNTGVAILIDDVDAGFGMWGDLYQYTVNTQIVIATLMHFADNPQTIDNQKVARVPIILTGNDFTKIYKPLSRPGRMRSFLWEPSENEKIEILKPIFPLLDDTDVRSLIAEFPNNPISFFTNLSSYIFQERIWDLFKNESREIVEKLMNGKAPVIEAHCFLGDLLDVGRNILDNSTYVNHLKIN